MGKVRKVLSLTLALMIMFTIIPSMPSQVHAEEPETELVSRTIIFKDKDGFVEGLKVSINDDVHVSDADGKIVVEVNPNMTYKIETEELTTNGIKYEKVMLSRKFEEDTSFSLSRLKKAIPVVFNASYKLDDDLVIICDSYDGFPITVPVVDLENTFLDLELGRVYRLTLTSKRFDDDSISKNVTGNGLEVVEFRGNDMKQFAFNVLESQNGTVSSDKAFIEYGGEYQLTVKANSGFFINKILINGDIIDEGMNQTDVTLVRDEVISNQDVRVEFKAIQKGMIPVEFPENFKLDYISYLVIKSEGLADVVTEIKSISHTHIILEKHRKYTIELQSEKYSMDPIEIDFEQEDISNLVIELIDITQLSINVSNTSGGNAVVDQDVIDYGGEYVLTAKAESGFLVDKVTINGVVVEDDVNAEQFTKTFEKVIGAQIIEVSFRAKTLPWSEVDLVDVPQYVSSEGVQWYQTHPESLKLVSKSSNDIRKVSVKTSVGEVIYTKSYVDIDDPTVPSGIFEIDDVLALDTAALKYNTEIRYFVEIDYFGAPVQRSEVLAFKTDNIAPSLRDLRIAGSSYPANPNGVHSNKDLKMTFSVSDAGSQLDRVDVKIGSIDYDAVLENGVYSVTINESELDESYTISLRDKVGNEFVLNQSNVKEITNSSMASTRLIIDRKAPTVTVFNEHENIWINEAKLTFKGVETGSYGQSGIASLELQYLKNGSYKGIFLVEEDFMVENYVPLSELERIVDLDDYFETIGTGKLTFRVVVRDIAGNETISENFDVRLDKTKPTISDIKINKLGTVPALEILQDTLTGTALFATYSHRDISIVVNTDDDLSGVSKVVFYTKTSAGYDAFDTVLVVSNEQTIYLKTPSNGVYDEEIYLVVIDKAGNKTDYIGLSEASSTIMSNRVVLESIPSLISIDTETDIAWNQGGIEWFNEFPVFDVSAEDSDSGLAVVTIAQNGKSLPNFNIKQSINDSENEKFLKHINSKDFSNILYDGLNTITVTSVDYAENRNEQSRSFRFDDINPVITSASIANGNNSVVYGAESNYSNDDVTLKIHAFDSLSGVQSVVLYEKVNDKYIEIDRTLGDEMQSDKLGYFADFKFPLSEEMLVKELYVQVFDNAKNTTGIVSISDFSEDMNSNVIKIEGQKPESSIIVDTNVTWVDSEGTQWFNEIPEYTIQASDFESGLRNVNVVHNQASLDSRVIPEFVNVYTQYDEKFLSKQITNVSEKEMNKIKVSVDDYATNMSSQEYSYRYDNQSPIMTNIRVMSEGLIETSGLIDKDSVFGAFIKEVSMLELTASDGEYGSGVESFTYFFLDSDTQEKSEERTVVADENGRATILVPSNAKGNIFVKASDFLGNNKEPFVSIERIVVENQAKHTSETKLALPLPSTNTKDKEGNPLYSKNISIPVSVHSTYSGIKEARIEVSSPYDTSNNQIINLDIQNDGTLSDKSWSIDGKDQNLVTKISRSLDVKNNSNAITLTLVVIDRAGFESRTQEVFSIDKTSPVIDVTYDTNDYDSNPSNDIEYYNTSRTATLRITERNFSEENVILEIVDADGGSVPVRSAWTFTQGAVEDENYYESTVVFSQDGQYTLALSFKDDAGNQAASYTSKEFSIDKTKPVIEASFIDGYKQYNASTRVLNITVDERNFDPSLVEIVQTSTLRGTPIATPQISTWSQDGTSHFATITYSDNGDYTYKISLRDRAGNQSNVVESEPFTVDLVIPTIKFSGVEDFSANKGVVAPIVEIEDSNFDLSQTTVTLTGAQRGVVTQNVSISENTVGAVWNFEDFKKEKEYDDIYVLSIQTTDKAGNTFSDQLTFSVNRFGSTYMFDTFLTSIQTKYVNTKVAGSIIEVNVDAINPSTAELKSILNGQATILESNIDYTVVSSGGSGRWNQNEYKLSNKNFIENGKYTIEVRSEDRAGNKNNNVKLSSDQEASMSLWFGVDTISPVINAMDAKSNHTYAESSHDFNYSVSDNIAIKSMKITVDNKDISDYTLQGDMLRVTVLEKNTAQTIQVTVEDLAGNSTTHVIEDVLITTNVFIRVYTSKWFYPGALGITCVTFFFFFILFKRRKEEEEEEGRGPVETK